MNESEEKCAPYITAGVRVCASSVVKHQTQLVKKDESEWAVLICRLLEKYALETIQKHLSATY